MGWAGVVALAWGILGCVASFLGLRLHLVLLECRRRHFWFCGVWLFLGCDVVSRLRPGKLLAECEDGGLVRMGEYGWRPRWVLFCHFFLTGFPHFSGREVVVLLVGLSLVLVILEEGARVH